MIEHGHRHKLVPVALHQLDEERTSITSRCQGSPDLDPTGGCSMEQQTVLLDGKVDGVRLRFNGVWFSVLDILRLGDGLTFSECPACHGTELLLDCETCLGVGVLQNGQPVRPPNLRAV